MLPFEAEIHCRWRREELQHEAEMARLAMLVQRRDPRLRARLAATLYAFAVRLDPTLRLRLISTA